ncbi:peptidoglycan-binding domain-containing protein [Streptomyces musisoli]|nr:peptidoglycan-binding domain-containing protein [Streptomyces musisoli]
MPTPPDPEEPSTGRILEPVRVLRTRHFDGLAELMREIRPDPVTYEPLAAPPGPRPAPQSPTGEDTQELPPAPAAPHRAGNRAADPGRAGPRTANPGRAGAPSAKFGHAGTRSADTSVAGAVGFGSGPRRAAVAVAVVAAALVGFGCALLLPGRQQAAVTARPSQPVAPATPAATAPPATASASPPPAASAAPTGATDPDGPGTLRRGDTGPGVTDLQRRLLHVPDVYRDGSTDGTYDATLTEAVARFQLRYGISGDETGVYGDDTRRALESRTGFGDDS